MKKLLLSLSILGISSSYTSQVIYPGGVTVGSQEVVFDYSVDKCNTIDIPDVPARAFRDAAGNINLIASHYTNWRMTGTDFISLGKDCSPVMSSDLNTDPSMFNNNEWIVATYTEDGTNVHALIHDEFVPCGNWNNCWYNGITYASSSDGGQTYSHTTAPSHLVAASPYESPYPTTHTPFGIFGGSNIIKKDGYYYVMVHLEDHLLQEWGAGLIRTDNLSDPTSWRGWDGSGFNVSFVNPYTATGYNAADKILAPVSRDRIGKMCASLTYNTYFGKYMVVDYTVGEVNGVLKYGFYYALSDDLINWSNKRLILQTTTSWAVGGSNYPSIIDHNSTTRNFEDAGQTCYLYYTKWNSGTYDRDLIRVPVTFSQQVATSFVVNTTGNGDDATPGDGLCSTTGNVCSLRAAIQEANARPTYSGYDEMAIPVTFNIAGSGVKTIQPASYLPEIFYPLYIDGYTQAGANENTNDFDQGLNTAITIQLNAEDGGAHAFAFHCGNNTVKGMSIINGNVDFLYEDGYSTGRNSNVVEGCFIGMGADGVTPYAGAININNQDSTLIGGTTNESRNLIGGGVILTKSSYNELFGNYFGSTQDGMTSSTTGAHSIQIEDTSSYNVIGGLATGERNLISGGNRGVMIQGGQSLENSVINNYIGIAIDGSSDLGNQSSGISLTDGTYSNVISGNIITSNSTDEAGIWMDNTHDNIIQSNYIGTNADQSAILGNGDVGTFSAGIMIMNGSSGNMIGGTAPSEGNVIANNNFGISLYTSTGSGNSFLSNYFYDNSEMGIDIDADYSVLGNDNGDGDAGANDLQNFPVLTSAYVASTQVSINGTFNSSANNLYTIQYYDNIVCDGSGNGEGKVLIGTETVTTNSSGNAIISAQYNVVVAVGHYITCLATGDASGSTSEFSECIITQSASAPSTPSITASGSLTFCEGGSVTLTSTSATSYLWSNGETTQSISATEDGDYTVTVYNTQGLSATSVVTTVTVNPAPAVTITGDTIICSGESTLLTASGADGYTWTSGPSTADYTVSPTSDATYIVSGTLNGCSTSISQLVTVNALPSTPVIIQNTTVLSSTSGANYQWYVGGVEINGATSQDYTPTATGVYSVMITDNNGCTASSDDFNYTLVGLTAIEHSNSFMVTPNPSTGKFHITFDAPKINNVKVLNAAGLVIYSSNTLNSEIDLSSHSKGVYFLKIETDDKMYIKKLIVN